ncbi:hypothetical protein ABS71_16440 [bacterium SCN 62-11]|nr:MAG: hypothetical protein ABS71_16440 [bacterium SCN 62-11]
MDLIAKPHWTEHQELAWATMRGSLLGLWESHYGDCSFRQNEEALKYGFTPCRHFRCDWDDVLEATLAASFAGDWKRSLLFVRRGWEMAQDPWTVERLQHLDA